MDVDLTQEFTKSPKSLAKSVTWTKQGRHMCKQTFVSTKTRFVSRGIQLFMAPERVKRCYQLTSFYMMATLAFNGLMFWLF